MKITKRDKLESKLRDIGVGECYYDPTSETYNLKTDKFNEEEETTLMVNLDTGEAFYEEPGSPAQKIESQLIVAVKK